MGNGEIELVSFFEMTRFYWDKFSGQQTRN
ncbi:hypothetical protein [Sicyoidochytrium minutum DNA virus]|nr:hypothetical protein [Sicyoidochytrium minutum DNA virus]